MAISLDTSSKAHATAGAEYTYSYTCTGSNLILFVNIFSQRSISPSGQDDVTGITYNGTAMTRVTTRTAYSGNWRMYTYYLINPATGAHDVVVTQTNYGNNYDVYQFTASYAGVLQTSSIDQFTDASTNGTTINTTVTTTYTSDWGLLLAVGEDGKGLTGSNCTVRQTDAGAPYAIFDTNGALTPAGSKTMTLTCQSQVVDTIMVTFKQLPITSSVSDTIDLTDTATSIKKLISSITDTITMIRVFLEAVTDTITASDVSVKSKKLPKTQSKNSASVSNHDKS